jgi:universal stress protein A
VEPAIYQAFYQGKIIILLIYRRPFLTVYHHILVAVDYSSQFPIVAQKAKAIAEIFEAKLSFLHVIDNIPMPQTPYGTVISLSQTTDNERLAEEQAKLKELGLAWGVTATNCWLVWGLPKRKISAFAEQQGFDLIVAGAYERHGLSVLLGSTVDGIRHHASCDVLSVKLPT